jgi:hypothetical protein
VARQIHELSWRRRGGPFVAVNCAALVETLIERSSSASRNPPRQVCVVDVGSSSMRMAARPFSTRSRIFRSAQAKLLRAIQELAVERVGGHGTRRVDVCIGAASNRPLVGLVAQGLFRADLFYRLSGVEIHVPALRSRPDDVLELARCFLGRHVSLWVRILKVRWREFETRWSRLLRRESLTTFNSDDFLNETGEVAEGWSDAARRRALLEALGRLAEQHVFRAFSQTLNLPDYDAINAEHPFAETAAGAYGICAALLMAHVRRWMAAKHPMTSRYSSSSRVT